jgi:rhodanese-related sulfurtransferase
VSAQLVTRALAIGALALGGLAAFVGSPRASGGDVDVESLAREVETEADHVTAIELARWIRDRKPDLRVVDLRDSIDFAQYHLPLAERIPLNRLVSTPFTPAETIVLYSGGGAHAAQGWVFLRARGIKQVFFLRGGAAEWLDEVMNPLIPVATASSSRAELDSIAALSRYFGGVPRRTDSVVELPRAESWKAASARVRGRGC